MWEWSVWICLYVGVVCLDMFICGSGLSGYVYMWEWSVWICFSYVVVVRFDMFMIYGTGLSGYVYDMWQWSVWICLLVVCFDIFICGSDLFGCVY